MGKHSWHKADEAGSDYDVRCIVREIEQGHRI